MNAIDTNIIVRIVTADDAAQAQLARASVESAPVFLSAGVVLESFWVLSKTYGLGDRPTAMALQRFCALETVVLDDPARIMDALDMAMQGYDFADALHLAFASAAGCDGFLTFDRALIRRARDLSGPKVRTP